MAALRASPSPLTGPFDPDDERSYRAWRDRKLALYPDGLAGLTVEVGDPRALTPSERSAMLGRCRRSNMVVYASGVRGADKAIPRQLGAQFGLASLDRNWLADDDGISEVRVAESGTRGDFIPYTDRPIRRHTDGYYNPPGRCIRATSSGDPG